MSFWRQFYLLIWKNVILRKQRKARLVAEIIWPLFLFIILMWVRTRGLRTNVPDCHFTERPLPSSGLLPFVRTYLCEMNSSCYSYPVNNNYDEEAFSKINTVAVNFTTKMGDLLENKSFMVFLNSSFTSAKLVYDTRLATSAYTRALTLTNSIDNADEFRSVVNNSLSLDNRTIELLFKSSPNYNLLYTNYSKPYQDPLTLVVAFFLTDVPTELINFLYGSDLDRLSAYFNNTVDDPKWIRIHLCDAQQTNSNKLFRFNNTNDELYFIENICNLTDNQLVDLVKNISSNINFNKIKEDVYWSTNLNDQDFLYTIIKPAFEFRPVQKDLVAIQQDFMKIAEENDLTMFLQNITISKLICGNSKLNIFNTIGNANFTQLLSTFSLRSADVSPITENQTNATSLTSSLLDSIKYLNHLSTLNDSTCPTKQTNLTQSYTCLCNTIFSSLASLPSSLQIVWKQIKPLILGKIIYTPNTLVYNNLIKNINRTFESIDQLTIVITQINEVLDQVKDYEEIFNQITKYLPKAYQNESQIKALLENVENISEILKLSKNLIDCIEINKFIGYETEIDAVRNGMDLIDKELFWATIVFDNTTAHDDKLPNKFTYKIRMNSSYTHNTFFTQDRFYTYGPNNNFLTSSIDFLYGFIYLQDIIEKGVIDTQTNTTNSFGLTTQMTPYPCYTNDLFVSAITRLLPLLMVLAWIYTVSMTVKDIVYEKEKRLKEFMRVMGLSNLTHWMAWFVTQFTSMMIISFLLCVILKYGKILTYSDFSVLLVFFCCFTIATIAQCFLISVFFNRANLAAVVAGIVYYILYLPYTVMVNYTDILSTFDKFLGSLSSTVAFSFGCELISTYELQAEGVKWTNFDKSPYLEGGLSMLQICLTCLLDAVIYMILTWYIENVAPGEFGIARPFYFPFLPSYWCGASFEKRLRNKCACCFPVFGDGNKKKRFINMNKNGDIAANTASMSTHQDDTQTDLSDDSVNEKVGIEITNLHKIYSRGNNHAVKGLSVNFYENEISAFLGHNGAGKSTTMHILTGLYMPTLGTAKINGLDITRNMNKIRKSLGFVPQHNVLFDDMSVIDHLWFYARLKGLENNATLIEIEKLLVDTGLQPKRNECAKNLSGGMQRKLSVAIAFVGGSKTVILDEPSAGVDPKGRRSIWDLLFKYRIGRTIVISTHHMDEADVLADRIAIIANGGLVTHGTSYYLKQAYGSGYYLTLAKKQANLDYINSVSKISKNKSEIDDGDEKQLTLPKYVDRLKTRDDIKIHDFIKSHIENALLIENIGCEMTYSISNKPEYTKSYEGFFHDFENHMSELGIDSIGISDTTLEEIFIKLAKQPEAIKKTENSNKCGCCNCVAFCGSGICDRVKSIFGLSTNETVTNTNGIATAETYNQKSEELNDEMRRSSFDINKDVLKTYSQYTRSRVDSKFVLLCQQFKSLIIKRFHRVKRNLKGFFAEIVLPVIFVCLALLVATLIPGIEPRPPLQLHPWHYGESTNIFYSKSSSPNVSVRIDNKVQGVVDTFFDKPSLGTRCMNNHQINFTTYHDYSRSAKTDSVLDCTDKTFTLANRTQLPSGLYDALQRTNYTYTGVSPSCECKTGFSRCPIGAGGDISYYHVSKLHTTDTLYDLTNRNITDWLIKTEFDEAFFRKRFGGFEFLEPILTDNLTNNINTLLSGTFSLINNKTINVKNSFLSNDRIKIWYNNKGYIAAVAFLNVLNNAILRSKLQEQNSSVNLSDYGIVAINHPMDFTTGDLANQLMLQLFIDLFVAICIIFALSFIPASFLVFLLEERENNSKQLQFVSGVKPYIYWLSNFMWDLINYFVPCILCILIFLIFDVKTYVSEENFPCLICLLLLYGWAVIPLMYPLNYLFQIPSTAFVLSSSLNVLIGVVSTMSTAILEQLGDEEPDLYEISNILKPIFICLFPHYCLGRGFLDMSVLYNTARAQRSLGIKSTFSPFDFDQVGKNMVALTIQGFVFFIINLLIEYKFFIRFKPSKFLPNFIASKSEDDDVKNERERVVDLFDTGEKLQVDTDDRANTRDYIKFNNLTKVYRKVSKCSFQRHVAVKSLCLGINKGECFGLIGVNGAGKSTTFKMLTGEIPITAGDAFINGYSVSREIEKVHQNIGYCPQSDAIFSLLTAKEHLLFYARLRGIPEKYVYEVTIWALNRVGLNVFADRMAGDFSGGNKRKLSTAIALVGDPSVIFLDEPTSGMDAKARRLLWNDILSLIKENRIVVLTSHSMEECEALCTRLVIMVNGEFKCLGSPQHLKSKFGNGYKLTIRLNSDEDSELQSLFNFIKTNFPTSSISETHKNLTEFTLPFQDTKLSKIFGCIEKNRAHLNIKDYSVSQTTLDQVFVNFAKAQDDDPTYSASNGHEKAAEAKPTNGTTVTKRVNGKKSNEDEDIPMTKF